MPTRSLLLTLLLSACLVNEDLYQSRQDLLRDDDGDGFGEDDCDDNDPDRHPSAPELCDGEDDNCNGTIDEGAIDRIWYLDADGDGFANPNAPQVSCPPPGPDYRLEALDCDDEDATIHPNASESCDGFDNNCDGATDEEPSVDASTWYLDADTDGYGDAEEGTRACNAPSDRHVSRPGDCDDTNSTIFPGAGELCDGIDQDCDGRVDDAPLVDPEAWYPDDDGDGYGDGSSPISSCGMGDGFVQENTDCDDRDDTVHPGAEEVCNNEFDDNCNDSPDGCVWPNSTDLEDHTIIRGVTTVDGLGYSGTVGDIDADGKPEAIIGAAAASASETELNYLGAVAVFESPISPVNRNYPEAETLLVGSGETTRAGRAVVAADINGDSFDDLLIGAPGESSRVSRSGAMYVIYGPHRGSGSIESFANWSLFGDTSTERIGDRLFAVGDLSGDGVDDFAMSNTLGATSSTAVPDGGAVYLFTSAGAGEEIARGASSTLIYSDGTGDDLGRGVVGLDIDGDGIHDLAAGAQEGGDDDQGITGLYFGPLGASLDIYDADLIWQGVDEFDSFGCALAAGDMNGDGAEDLVASACQEGSADGFAGSVYIFFGGSSVTPSTSMLSAGDAEHKIRNDALPVGFNTVSTLGDLNRDGFDDLGLAAGNAAMFYGPFEGGVELASTYDVILQSSGRDGDAYMNVMVNGGDLFGDGADDIFIGSSDYNGGDTSISGYGRAYLIPGISW
jgi:hypothetical protein